MAQLVASLLIFTFIPSVFTDVESSVGRIQSAGVKGTLLCKGVPAPNILVKLYDDDRGEKISRLSACLDQSVQQ